MATTLPIIEVGPSPVLSQYFFKHLEKCLGRTRSRPYENVREAVPEEVRYLIDEDGNFEHGLISKIPKILQFEPHHILFTAFSALPLADVFRGIFEYHEKEVPVLGVVNTKTTDLSQQISHDIHGCDVVVIDQYFNFGTTLASAIHIARNHGAQEVLPVSGRWYEEADNKALGMDTSTMSCTYAGELQQIGRKIAQLAKS